MTMLFERQAKPARCCRIRALNRLATTFLRHLDGIHNILDEANSNAVAESVNADVQTAIARARGSRAFGDLRTAIYLLKSGLNLPRHSMRM